MVQAVENNVKVKSEGSADVRYYFIDALRVYTFLFLIAYHTGLVFCGWRWHIESEIPSHQLEHFLQFLTQWRISLLFTVSGAGVAMLYKKVNSWEEFLENRLRRVLLPLCTSFVVILPFQLTLECLWQGYPIHVLLSEPWFFLVGYKPIGHYSLQHVWYLIEIWNICVISIPLLVWLKRKRFLTSRHGSTIVSAVIGLLIGIQFLTLMPWVEHIAFFILGFYLATASPYYQFLRKNVVYIVTAGAITYSILVLFFWKGEYSSNPYDVRNGTVWVKLAYRCLVESNEFLWVLGITGVAVKYCNYRSAFVHKLNTIILPMYIFHQVILMALAYQFADLHIANPIKIGSLLVATLVGSYLVASLVNMTPFTRILFGLKAKKKQLVLSPPGETKVLAGIHLTA